MPKDITSAADVLARIGLPQAPVDIAAARAEQERTEAERRVTVTAAWAAYEDRDFGEHWRTSVLSHIDSKIRHKDSRMLAEGRGETTPAMVAASRWLSGTRPILVLLGPTGTGKSVAATWAAIESVRAEAERIFDHRRAAGIRLLEEPTPEAGYLRAPKGVAPAWVASPRVPRTFDPWAKEADEPELAWSHPFVVIDDWGTEQLTPRWQEAFGALIDERLACDTRRVRTVITTNLKRKEIRPRYGDRIADRFNANSICVELKAKSMRDQGQGL